MYSLPSRVLQMSSIYARDAVLISIITPTNISDEQIPELVPHKPLQEINIPVQSPSNEEADQEVAMICRAPEYYWVRSHVRHRRQYFMYNALDDIGEIIQQKRPRKKSPSVQGHPVEH